MRIMSTQPALLPPMHRVAASTLPSRARPTTCLGPGVDPIPSTPDVMDPTAGAWVREHALTAYHRREGSLLRLCSCQYGICGACERGRCDQCLQVQLLGRPDSPGTYLTDRRGLVRGLVWPAGRPCRYACPCRCPKTASAPLVVAPVPEQLDLFDLLSEDHREALGTASPTPTKTSTQRRD